MVLPILGSIIMLFLYRMEILIKNETYYIFYRISNIDEYIVEEVSIWEYFLKRRIRK